MDVTTSNKDRTAATERRQGEGGWRMPPRSVAATGIRRTMPRESSTAQVWPSGEQWGTISCNGNRRPYNAWVGSITSTMAVETTVLLIWGVCGERFHVRRVEQPDLAGAFQQIEDGLPKHAPPNVAKAMAEWEYGVAILSSDLRARLRAPQPAATRRLPLCHEGARSQDPGASHVHAIPSPPEAAGG